MKCFADFEHLTMGEAAAALANIEPGRLAMNDLSPLETTLIDDAKSRLSVAKGLNTQLQNGTVCVSRRNLVRWMLFNGSRPIVVFGVNRNARKWQDSIENLWSQANAGKTVLVEEIAIHICGQEIDQADRRESLYLKSQGNDVRSQLSETELQLYTGYKEALELVLGAIVQATLQHTFKGSPYPSLARPQVATWLRSHGFPDDWLGLVSPESDAAQHELFTELTRENEALKSELAEAKALATPKQPETPLHLRARRTLLTIVAALCDYSNIDYKEKGASVQIAKLTDDIGAPVSDDTVRALLKDISEALESRQG